LSEEPITEVVRLQVQDEPCERAKATRDTDRTDNADSYLCIGA